MRTRSKIAVLGFTEHRAQAPFFNDEWELWGLNDLYFEMPDQVPYERIRWFQIHGWRRKDIPQHAPGPFDFSEGPPNPRDPNHVKWLAETAARCPVYLMQPAPEVPDGVVLDRERFYRYFDDGYGEPIRYFTNSISWAIALAIMELAPEGPGSVIQGAEIGVWGVDMMQAGGPGSEYGWQRPSCEFFVGWARGLGIPVHIPRSSDLLKSAFDYGDETHGYFRERVQGYRNEMSRRRGQMHTQVRQAELAHSELTGAINAADWLLRSHMPGDPGDPQAGDVRVPAPNMHKGQEPTITAPVGINRIQELVRPPTDDGPQPEE